jgi:hypothetical protein
MCMEKRIHDLEDDVKKLEAVNKRLKEELKNYKKKVSRSRGRYQRLQWVDGR